MSDAPKLFPRKRCYHDIFGLDCVQFLDFEQTIARHVAKDLISDDPESHPDEAMQAALDELWSRHGDQIPPVFFGMAMDAAAHKAMEALDEAIANKDGESKVAVQELDANQTEGLLSFLNRLVDDAKITPQPKPKKAESH